jgi:Flp pilus assembly protein TadG
MKQSTKLEPRRKRHQDGVILLLGCLCLPVIMGMLGISIDLSILYSVKARLQTACDGAAMAALRSLSLGQTISSQTTAATAVANSWFRANYSSGFMGTYNTSNPPTVAVAQNASTLLTTVDITASTTVPTYFMKYWNAGANVITTTSQASRRNVVITLVLDRSGSMSNVNNSYNGQTPCQVMVTAAKQFTGMFQPTRDYLGLVTFAGSVNIAQSPTTNFQSVLGYSNSAGSGNGVLDNITCSGGTNTPTAVSIAWNENYKVQLPGALNVIVLMTDGQPTAATYKFVTTAANDPTGVARSAIKTTSGCKDSAGKAMSASGNMVTSPRNWIYSRETNTGGTYTINLGANSYSGWSPISGPVGGVYADDSGFYGLWPFFSPTSTLLELTGRDTNEAPGCSFATGSYNNSPTTDVAFLPDYDLFGNASAGFESGLTRSTVLSAQRITMNRANVNIAIDNLTDNAANFARTSHYLPNGSTAYGGNVIFVVGLGGNGGVNHTLLQRIANDPNASPDNGSTYPAYNAYNVNQPVGTYIYSADSTQLGAAFLKIASQILRLSI